MNVEAEIIEPSNAISWHELLRLRLRAMEICESAFMRSTSTKMDKETHNEYKSTIRAFGVQWITVKESKAEFRYVDSCFQFGVLEQSITPILRESTVIGQKSKFRLNPNL